MIFLDTQCSLTPPAAAAKVPPPHCMFSVSDPNGFQCAAFPSCYCVLWLLPPVFKRSIEELRVYVRGRWWLWHWQCKKRHSGSKALHSAVVLSGGGGDGGGRRQIGLKQGHYFFSAEWASSEIYTYTIDRFRHPSSSTVLIVVELSRACCRVAVIGKTGKTTTLPRQLPCILGRQDFQAAIDFQFIHCVCSKWIR